MFIFFDACKTNYARTKQIHFNAVLVSRLSRVNVVKQVKGSLPGVFSLL